MGYQVLLAEDEARMRDIVRDYLAAHGWACDLARNGAECLDLLRDHDYDALLLDVLMPELDGFAVCRAVRCGSGVPILFLTALGGEEDVLRGYALGADDYVTKPFSPSELVARVDAICRRVTMAKAVAEKEQQEIKSGPFVLNYKSRTLTKDGEIIDLTQVEYQIMELFMKNPNTAMERSEILSKVWGDNYYSDAKIVDVNIRRLRLKIEDVPSEPRYLTTIWGYGYKWNS